MYAFIHGVEYYKTLNIELLMKFLTDQVVSRHCIVPPNFDKFAITWVRFLFVVCPIGSNKTDQSAFVHVTNRRNETKSIEYYENL